MKKSKKMILAVAWYKAEQWSRLLEISADADQLEKTYSEWQLIAEKALNDFAVRGFCPIKMMMDVDDLLAWCSERDLPVNGENRSQYASWLLKEQAKKKK